MIEIQNITIKNFLSTGNAMQTVDFRRRDLTLVLGENLDLGGNGSRNAAGKTTLLAAVCYALYGQSLTNIRKDNLVNRTNGRNMLVVLDFSVGGRQYRIERGRKPNVLKFYIDHQEQQSQDNAQGDSRETQADIDRILNMSHDMFRQIVGLNTYTEPFLAMKANDQRLIIEQLLGITLLSERADRIRELNRETKDAIAQEEFRIKAVTEANVRIQEQIASLTQRAQLWNTRQSQEVTKLTAAIQGLSMLDIDAEIQAHRNLQEHQALTKIAQECRRWMASIAQDQSKIARLQADLARDIQALEAHQCPACGQDLHDNTHETILEQKRRDLQDAALQALSLDTQYHEHTERLQAQGDPGPVPEVFYDNLEQALNHRNSLDMLQRDCQAQQALVNPYTEQIQDMQNQALQTISYDDLNALTRLQEHQDFLLKLLTNKDSFIRKKIIEQNLGYLNARLTHYLTKIGLPHTVKFQNDLTVSIEELGRELDFFNLSRGEMTRVILSLNLAFRDVFESLYEPINLLYVDELIDNGMDSSGTENALAILKKMARDSNKSVWLVSHKDELTSRVDNVMMVTKTQGFTEYSMTAH